MAWRSRGWVPRRPSPATHLIFFNSDCTRAESVDLPLTADDVEIPLIAGSGGLAGVTSGLVAIGGSVNGIDLVALQNPIHVKVHRFNITDDFVRVYDPISALNAEEWTNSKANLPAALLGDPDGSFHTWNPLRTGATFFVPVLGGAFSANLEFACPRALVFDAWVPGGVPAVPASGVAGTISGRVFDDDENFRRDISTSCFCLAETRVASLSTVYSDATLTTNGYFTELLGTGGAFTGWRALVFTSGFVPGGQLDDHSRLNNANQTSLGSREAVFGVRGLTRVSGPRRRPQPGTSSSRKGVKSRQKPGHRSLARRGPAAICYNWKNSGRGGLLIRCGSVERV